MSTKGYFQFPLFDAAHWAASELIIPPGVACYNTDTKEMVVGDGTKTVSQLTPYSQGVSPAGNDGQYQRRNGVALAGALASDRVTAQVVAVPNLAIKARAAVNNPLTPYQPTAAGGGVIRINTQADLTLRPPTGTQALDGDDVWLRWEITNTHATTTIRATFETDTGAGAGNWFVKRGRHPEKRILPGQTAAYWTRSADAGVTWMVEGPHLEADSFPVGVSGKPGAGQIVLPPVRVERAFRHPIALGDAGPARALTAPTAAWTATIKRLRPGIDADFQAVTTVTFAANQIWGTWDHGGVLHDFNEMDWWLIEAQATADATLADLTIQMNVAYI